MELNVLHWHISQIFYIVSLKSLVEYIEWHKSVYIHTCIAYMHSYINTYTPNTHIYNYVCLSYRPGSNK